MQQRYEPAPSATAIAESAGSREGGDPSAPVHRTRRTILEREATWRLAADVVERTAEGEAGRCLPYADIAGMRLSYDPTRFETNRYSCEFCSRCGDDRIVSVSYVSPVNFDNRLASYAPFVRALATRVARANPSCRFRAGKRSMIYIAEQVFLLTMLLLLVSVLYFTGVPVAGVVAIKLALIALYVPVMIRYTRVNRPRRFDPNDIPADILPD